MRAPVESLLECGFFIVSSKFKMMVYLESMPELVYEI